MLLNAVVRLVLTAMVTVLSSLNAWGASIEDYRIAPGDVLTISVFGEPELSLGSIRVPANGELSYPLIGNVQVAGSTAKELEATITNRLDGGYLRNPKVTISILEYRPVFVHGGVIQSGAQQFAEGMTVEKAIAVAGGLGEYAMSEEIYLQRHDGTELFNVAMGEVVFPGDIVRVPVADKPEPVVPGATGITAAPEPPKQYLYFTGQVKKPGSFEYREGMSVRQALALAGGMTPRGSRKKVTITRETVAEDTDDDVEVLKRVNLSEKVKPGDVIDVGAKLF